MHKIIHRDGKTFVEVEIPSSCCECWARYNRFGITRCRALKDEPVIYYDEDKRDFTKHPDCPSLQERMK